MVWRKGRYFVVVDEVEATQAGAFALQCSWRTLGTPTLEANRLETVQRDPEDGREDRFVLEGVGGDRILLERDWESFGHWWKGLSLFGRLRQYPAPVCKPGDGGGGPAYVYQSVLCDQPGKAGGMSGCGVWALLRC